MDDEQRNQLETLRQINQERLRKLEQQAATFGLYAPPHVLTDLDAARAEIARIDGELAQAAPIAQTPFARVANPPIAPTPLIGREHEVEQLSELLRRPELRLITLTGPGGIGKTRLALQVAANMEKEFAAGACFVALAAVADAALVPATIDQALGLRDVAGEPLAIRLANYLRDRQLLLLLDNFEQVIAAASLVSQLLAAVRGLKVLVTSRAVLRLAGEHEFAVLPLTLPDPQQASQATTAEAPAVRLFVERARAARPDFVLTDANAGAVVAICARLDGLPLAIELAAARARLLTPQALLDRLNSPLKLLTSGARDLPTRQQTLRGAIDWSYQLLDAGAQALFARLAVFAGGFTLDAAEAICTDFRLQIADCRLEQTDQSAISNLQFAILDGLGTLVENSLLRQADGMNGEPRFAMLETLREYARERLAERGEDATLRERHAAYYLALAERAETEGVSQIAWLEHLDQERNNLRAALSWALKQQAVAVALRLSSALWWFWSVHGYLSEGRSWLEQTLALPGAQAETLELALRSALAKAQYGAGYLAQMQGDYAQASARYTTSLALRRALDDKPGIATTLASQGHVAMRQGDHALARELFEQSLVLRRELGRAQDIADSLLNLGTLRRLQGDYAQATSYTSESLALFRNLNHQRGIAAALSGLGNVALEQGDYAAAGQSYEQALALYREMDAKRSVAISINNLGRVAHGQGAYAQAKASYNESLALLRELGDRRGAAIALKYLGNLLRDESDFASATAAYVESLALFRDLRDTDGIADCLEGFAALKSAQAHPDRAARLWGAAEALRAILGSPVWPAERAAYDHAMAQARTTLGQEAFAAAWAAGRALPLEQAITEALE